MSVILCLPPVSGHYLAGHDPGKLSGPHSHLPLRSGVLCSLPLAQWMLLSDDFKAAPKAAAFG